MSTISKEEKKKKGRERKKSEENEKEEKDEKDEKDKKDEKEEKETKIHFFTVATSSTQNLKRMCLLFDYHGEILHISGLTDTRVKNTGWGFGYKLIYLLEFLLHPPIHISSHDLVVALDSNDILPNFPREWGKRKSFCRKEFKLNYEKFDSGIVFNAQWFFGKEDFPYAPKSSQLKLKRFAGLCSGGFIGRKDSLLSHLQSDALFDWRTDDQDCWIYRYFSQTNSRWNKISSTNSNPRDIREKIRQEDKKYL